MPGCTCRTKTESHLRHPHVHIESRGDGYYGVWDVPGTARPVVLKRRNKDGSQRRGTKYRKARVALPLRDPAQGRPERWPSTAKDREIWAVQKAESIKQAPAVWPRVVPKPPLPAAPPSENNYSAAELRAMLAAAEARETTEVEKLRAEVARLRAQPPQLVYVALHEDASAGSIGFPIAKPGLPLTDEEAAHVDDTMARLILKSGASWAGMSSNDFLKLLGWPQRRYADVRDHVEAPATRERIGARVGYPLLDSFMSRSTFSLTPVPR